MLKSFAGDTSDGIAGWREDDSLWFVVRGRSGEPVACLHVGGMESGRLPSMSDVECADLMTQLIGLAVHKEQERVEREQRSTSMVKKSDLLEDILRIASSVVSERDLNKVSEMVLSSVSSLFGFARVSLVTYDEGAAAFKWTALFGYPEHAARQAKLRAIPMEIVLEDLRESRRIAKTVYFTPMEDVPRRNIEYFVNPEEVDSLGPRPDPVGTASSEMGTHSHSRSMIRPAGSSESSTHPGRRTAVCRTGRRSTWSRSSHTSPRWRSRTRA